MSTVLEGDDGGATAPPNEGDGGAVAPPWEDNGETFVSPLEDDGGTFTPPLEGDGGAFAPPEVESAASIGRMPASTGVPSEELVEKCRGVFATMLPCGWIAAGKKVIFVPPPPADPEAGVDAGCLCRACREKTEVLVDVVTSG